MPERRTAEVLLARKAQGISGGLKRFRRERGDNEQRAAATGNGLEAEYGVTVLDRYLVDRRLPVAVKSDQL